MKLTFDDELNNPKNETDVLSKEADSENDVTSENNNALKTEVAALNEDLQNTEKVELQNSSETLDVNSTQNELNSTSNNLQTYKIGNEIVSEEVYLQRTAEADLYRERQNKRIGQKYFKTPLVLSLLGMLLSIFLGIGFIFSLIGLSLALIRYKRNKKQSLKWAIWIGSIGLIMNISFFSIYTIYDFLYQISISPSQIGF